MGEQPDIRWIGEEPEIYRGIWWGVTTGSNTYLSYAVTREQALTNVAQEIGVPADHLVVPVVHPHEDEYQEAIKARYPERHVVRVIPFSMVEWPEDLDNTTAEQEAALTAVWGPRPE